MTVTWHTVAPHKGYNPNPTTPDKLGHRYAKKENSKLRFRIEKKDDNVLAPDRAALETAVDPRMQFLYWKRLFGKILADNGRISLQGVRYPLVGPLRRNNRPWHPSWNC